MLGYCVWGWEPNEPAADKEGDLTLGEQEGDASERGGEGSDEDVPMSVCVCLDAADLQALSDSSDCCFTRL